MTDILEMIEDLEMLDALDTVSREAHLEFLINKYKTRADDVEADMARQFDMEGI
tara:strand:- start:690 stop:851 length:162 start_codon:yes stop_codon:yes gene_type:complete